MPSQFLLARITAKVRVYQGSVLSPLFFVIVLEAMNTTLKFTERNLVIIADSVEECPVRRLLISKEAVERKGLRVNAGKTEFMRIPMRCLWYTSSSNNSIFCNGCKLWVHNKCSGLQRMTPTLCYRCTWCRGGACHIDRRLQSKVQIRPDKLEVVASFCYLGDMLGVN